MRSLSFSLVIVAFAAATEGTALEGGPTLGLTLEGEWAYEPVRGRSQKLELTVLPELQTKLPFDFELTATARLRVDAQDRVTPGVPEQSEGSPASRRLGLGDRGELELRELILERDLGPAWLQIGKQQIVWGKADGLKVLDVVNPQGFREFVLDDFDDSRIPLWSLTAEIPVTGLPASLFGAMIEDTLLQVLWIPDLTFHDLPERGATFAFTADRFVPRPPPGVSVTLEETERPQRLLADSEVGLRLSTFLGGFDLSFHYLYHHHDAPALFRSVEADGIHVTPRYPRTHLLGLGFASAFGDLTVRGEAGASFGRLVTTRDPADADGVRARDTLAFVLGLDWWGLSDTLFSLQVFETWIPRRSPGMVLDERETILTFLGRREFWNDTLLVEALWLHTLDDGDGLLRPKVRWEVNDGVQLWIGADVFYGSRQGLFGEFDRADRIVTGFEIAAG